MIIQLGWDDEPEHRIPKSILRRKVFARDKGRCKLCGEKVSPLESWDLARNRAGGEYTLSNCFLAHHSCNISQGRLGLGQARRKIGLSNPKAKPKRKAIRDSWTGEIVGWRKSSKNKKKEPKAKKYHKKTKRRKQEHTYVFGVRVD